MPQLLYDYGKHKHDTQLKLRTEVDGRLEITNDFILRLCLLNMTYDAWKRSSWTKHQENPSKTLNHHTYNLIDNYEVRVSGETADKLPIITALENG